jgi:hypothetical protein
MGKFLQANINGALHILSSLLRDPLFSSLKVIKQTDTTEAEADEMQAVST